MKKFTRNKAALSDILKIGNSKTTNIRITIVIIASIIVTILSPLLSYITKLIFDEFAVAYNSSISNEKEIIVLLIVFAAISLIIVFLNKLCNIENEYIHHDTSCKINNHIFEKIKRIRYEFFEEPKTYDIISRVSKNCPKVYSLLNSIIDLVMAVISTITFALLLSSIKWYFVIVILVPNSLYVYAEMKNTLERYYLEINQTNDYRKLDYLHDLFRDKKTNKEIRAYGISSVLLNRYSNLREKLYKEGIKLLFKQSLLSFFLLFISKIGLFICLYLTCVAFVNGENTVGDVTLLLTAGTAFSTSFYKIFSNINLTNIQIVYLDDWECFNSFQEETKDNVKINGLVSLEFRNVSFKYPSSKKFALESINFKISSGQTVALVGKNGSGKSTFLKILLGGLYPTSGCVLVNNKNINNVLKQLREKTAYIPQEFARYNLTLAENIKLANSSIPLEQMPLQFLNFIDKLPYGYNTYLGNIYNDGITLSGGEWQRISIERALIKENVELYIMDEPAASLDPIMESELYKEFLNTLKGKTKIITSHRLGACSIADCIYVFENGRIIESGTHAELMKNKNTYYNMYQAQSHLYERDNGE